MEWPKVNKDLVEGMVAVIVVGGGLAAECLVLVHGVPNGVDGVILGRVLGTFDAAILIVLNYYFGSTRASMQQVDAITAIGQAAANAPINISNDGQVTRTTSPAEEAVTGSK